MLICLDMRTGAGCGGQTVNNARFCEHCGKNLRFALMLHDSGTLVGRYQVVRVIGYGGFGAIYEALGVSAQRVALKETFDGSSISTFEREFALLSRLSHANLPRYLDMFEVDRNGYLVMEYVPAQSLQDVLDSQAELLPESQVLGYALQLCDVLSYLHSQEPPILHRDVKPANIRLTPEGRIKLVDFGLYKIGSYQTRARIRGLGTPAYAPIEQYANNQQTTNPRSDIYALGATLYHLLSGNEPPSAPDRLISDEPLPPWPAGLSAHLTEAIIKAMSVMPDGRFADMKAFKQALQGTQQGDKQLSTRITGQPTAQKEAQIPVSPLDRASSWLTQPFDQMGYGYVMPSSAKSLPHLPLKVSGKVLKVAFHSDGTLIGMTKKGIVYQWRVPDGQLLKILSLGVPSESEVETIAYSPTGDTVATTSKDYIVRVWRTQDGQLLHKLRGHGGLVKTLAYAPTGQVLASGSSHDDLICFWHVSTGKLLRKIDKKTRSLAFSPDGSHLVDSYHHASHVWRLANHKRLHMINIGCNNTNAIQWDPSGKMLIYGYRDNIVLYDAIKGTPIHAFSKQESYIASVAWHPNGHQVAAGDLAGRILIFTLGKNEPLHLGKEHRNGVLSLAYAPDGRFLASGGRDERVRLWALRTPRLRAADSAYLPATTSSHHGPLEVVESPPFLDKEGISARSTAHKRPTGLEGLSNYVEATHDLDLPHLVCHAEGKVRTVGYHVNAKELIGITEEGTLYRWHVKDGQLIKKQGLLGGQNKLTCAAISPDGQTLAIGDRSLMVLIWRLKDGKLLHRLGGHTQEIKALAYTPDSQTLASSGGKDETIRLWRVADGKLLGTIKAKKPTISLKFSPSGQYLACGSSLRVHLWRIADQKWRGEVKTGCNNDQAISWSPDERFLLCGHAYNVYIWRVVDGQKMRRFKGHPNTIRAVTWHPNGQLLVSGGSDKTVRVWSPVAPHLRHVAEGHKKTVHSVAVSQDGRTLASASEDGTVRLWLLAEHLDKTLDETLDTPTHQPTNPPTDHTRSAIHE